MRHETFFIFSTLAKMSDFSPALMLLGCIYTWLIHTYLYFLISDSYLPKTHEVAKCKWVVRVSNEPDLCLEHKKNPHKH